MNSGFIKDIIGTNGLIANSLPNYEPREGQIKMAEAVLDALLNDEKLVVEAGTGIGKSFAYLIPAILSINENDKPIVVSTNTIMLQEQLINKDLPWLKKTLNISFTFELGKGRNNYISKRRLDYAFHKKTSLFDMDDEFAEIKKIADWEKLSYTGSKSELTFKPNLKVWDAVQSNRDNCLGKKCRTYKNCHYYLSREKLKNANIIVVNHALLLADLQLKSMGKQLLPYYDKLIIDEAHRLEGVAGEQLGSTISIYQYKYLLNQIYQPKKKKGYFANHAQSYKLDDVIENAHLAIDDFFLNLHHFANEHTKPNETSFRLRQKGFIDTSNLKIFYQLHEILNEMIGGASDENEALQIESFLDRLSTMVETTSNIIFQEAGNDFVFWLEKNTNNRPPTMHMAPINVAPVLNDMLFKKIKSVVLTSATLSTDKKESGFLFFSKKIGLSQFKNLQVYSPFPYDKNVTIHIPPNIANPQSADYENQIFRSIKHYIEKTDGGAFVLFTSYYLMKKSFLELQYPLKLKGYYLFCQGQDLSRTQMIEEFKNSNHSVLFGTDSFWEGVDIQGDSLRNVIITKLPFAVPSHPINQAKHEQISEEGKNPFNELSLPEAIIKFKQGFGRLVRSHQDKGLCCILDPRVIQKSYGKKFLDSLPKCQTNYDNVPTN